MFSLRCKWLVGTSTCKTNHLCKVVQLLGFDEMPPDPHLCTKDNRCVLAATFKLYRQLECSIYSLGGLQGKGINIQLCGKAQLRGGRPGPFYHVNDISVYLE